MIKKKFSINLRK